MRWADVRIFVFILQKNLLGLCQSLDFGTKFYRVMKKNHQSLYIFVPMFFYNLIRKMNSNMDTISTEQQRERIFCSIFEQT